MSPGRGGEAAGRTRTGAAILFAALGLLLGGQALAQTPADAIRPTDPRYAAELRAAGVQPEQLDAVLNRVAAGLAENAKGPDGCTHLTKLFAAPADYDILKRGMPIHGKYGSAAGVFKDDHGKDIEAAVAADRVLDACTNSYMRVMHELALGRLDEAMTERTRAGAFYYSVSEAWTPSWITQNRADFERRLGAVGATPKAFYIAFGRFRSAWDLARNTDPVAGCVQLGRFYDNLEDDDALKKGLPIFGSYAPPNYWNDNLLERAQEAEATGHHAIACSQAYARAVYATADGKPLQAEGAMARARASYAHLVEAAAAGTEQGKAAGELAAQARVGGRRVALLIANAAYDAKANVPVLRTPEHDADLVAAALKKAGFSEVRIVRNVGRAGMTEALARFRDVAGSADVALVYFAGHGLQHDSQNYAVPIDAKLADPDRVAQEALPQQVLLDAMAPVGKLKILIMDACRNNPFAALSAQSDAAGAHAAADGAPTRSLTHGLTRGLVRIVPPKSHAVILYSAGPGQTALDGDPNSPFATSLSRHMLEPGVEIGVMLRQVSADVETATKSAQRPDSAGNLGADPFFFIAPKN